MTRRDWFAFGLVLLVGAIAWRAQLFSRLPLADEEPYLCAARALVNERDLTACPRYLYSLGVAQAGAWLLRHGGELTFHACTRGLIWGGAALTLWLPLTEARVSLWSRASAAAIAMLLWPPATQAMTYGNLSAATAGLTVLALTWRRAHPWYAGLALGAAIALKPLPAAVPIVLLAQASASALRTRRWRSPELTTGLFASLFALVVTAWGGGLPALPSSAEATNLITVARLVRELGGNASELACFVAVLLVGAALATSARFAHPKLLDGLSLVVSLLAAPLVWNHSFLLVTPLLIAAAVHALSRYRGAPSGEPRKWALLGVLASACATLAVAFSDDFGNVSNSMPLGALPLLLPLLSPAALLGYLAFSKYSGVK
ncbi:MAG TPA: glycosyltransferase 87 family protein [Polyangiaceae bacterium]|nr:glycosyltransferase 87 family protein [Polyangiaceae bacterium]